MGKLNGGYATYGADIGILMLDCKFPRPVGDIGNAKTFPFPVCYEIIQSVEASKLTVTGAADSVEKMIRHAQQLEAFGVSAILTSCGLLAAHQDTLAARLSVPVVSSMLLALPFIRSMLAPDKKIGLVVSMMTDTIREMLAKPENGTVIPISMGASPEFMRGIMSMRPPYELDCNKLEQETLAICREALVEHADIGAFVIECTNIAPYSPAIRRELRLPVFDILQIAYMLHTAVCTD